MAYATRADLESAYGKPEIDRLALKSQSLTGDAAEAARAAAIADALERAEIEANSIIGDRVRSLLANPDLAKAVRWQVQDIARYYLYDDRATTQVETRYKDALLKLARIRAGQEGLGIAGGTDTTLAADNAIQISSGESRGWQGGAY